ncbi:MAG: hypothetical protein M1831_006149 [Alyxoria varia]|nr:MAG: hypothetical protein M1831_006149 [Alyxoria varia]
MRPRYNETQLTDVFPYSLLDKPPESKIERLEFLVANHDDHKRAVRSNIINTYYAQNKLNNASKPPSTPTPISATSITSNGSSNATHHSHHHNNSNNSKPNTNGTTPTSPHPSDLNADILAALYTSPNDSASDPAVVNTLKPKADKNNATKSEQKPKQPSPSPSTNSPTKKTRAPDANGVPHPPELQKLLDEYDTHAGNVLREWKTVYSNIKAREQVAGVGSKEAPTVAGASVGPMASPADNRGGAAAAATISRKSSTHEYDRARDPRMRNRR